MLSRGFAIGLNRWPEVRPIRTNQAFWFRFNQGITSSGGTVSQWDDQSGNGRHLKQATGENQPVDGTPGSELITNGNFSADSNWTKGTGWTISGGSASSDGSQTGTSDLTQSVTLTDSKAHLIVFDVANRTAGSVTPIVGGTSGTARNTNGTFSEVITTSTTEEVTIQADASFVGDIDNVSVKEITQDGSIYFPGVDEFLKCDAFTFNQPATIYLLGKQVTWSVSEDFYDGNSSNVMRLTQDNSSPNIGLFAGSPAARNGDLAMDTYGVVAAVFDGADSVLQVNNNDSTTGDPGAGNAGGFTLGGRGGSVAFSNIQVKEVIGYSAAHTATQRLKNIRYLASLGGVTL